MNPAKSEPWRLLESGPGAPALNMAVDEALLEAAATLVSPEPGAVVGRVTPCAPQTATDPPDGAHGVTRPTLRFYGWTEPAATFGYFQKFSEIERATALRPLLRRPTGGGLVPHNADWTYSLIFPPGHSWHALRATESYERTHAWLRAAFARLGLATELAPCCRREIPGQCFAGYEKSDLLWHERKIAGAAQRRTKDGLLIQGSVQPPPGVTRDGWQQAMCEVARMDWAAQWMSEKMSGPLTARAQELVETKYARAGYNRKR